MGNDQELNKFARIAEFGDYMTTQWIGNASKISLASGKISLDKFMEQAIYWTPSTNVSKL